MITLAWPGWCWVLTGAKHICSMSPSGLCIQCELVIDHYQHALIEDLPGISPLQPFGPNWNVAGAHLSQFLPTTLGRHWHWPPLGSHTVLREPWGSHWHSGKWSSKQGHIRRPTSFNCSLNERIVLRCFWREWWWQIYESGGLRTTENCEEEETSSVLFRRHANVSVWLRNERWQQEQRTAGMYICSCPRLCAEMKQNIYKERRMSVSKLL